MKYAYRLRPEFSFSLSFLPDRYKYLNNDSKAVSRAFTLHNLYKRMPRIIFRYIYQIFIYKFTLPCKNNACVNRIPSSSLNPLLLS